MTLTRPLTGTVVESDGDASMLRDDEYEQWRIRIDARFAYWFDAFGLAHWDLNVVYRREGGRRRSATTLMEVSATAHYMQATITVYVNTIHEHGPSDEVIDNWCVHEILHAVLDPLDEGIRKSQRDQHLRHEERAVSHIASVMAKQTTRIRELEAQVERFASSV